MPIFGGHHVSPAPSSAACSGGLRHAPVRKMPSQPLVWLTNGNSDVALLSDVAETDVNFALNESFRLLLLLLMLRCQFGVPPHRGEIPKLYAHPVRGQTSPASRWVRNNVGVIELYG